MKCIRCRRELTDEARFCPDCGLKVDTKETAGVDTAPATSGLPGLPPLPETPSFEKQNEGAFVPASFDQVTVNPANTSPAEPATVPGPVSEPLMRPDPVFVPVPQGYTAPAVPAGYASAPVLLTSDYPIEESDYYHLDATEIYDFEAFRGISIVLMVFSALTMFGILFPLPICIVTLVFSCLGNGDHDPRRAKSRFKVCKILTVISIVTVILLIIGIYVLRYLNNYTNILNL